MRRLTRGRLTAFILLLLVSGAACNKSSESGRPLLWRIEGKKPSYLFGTIHIPDDRLQKLNPLVKKALDQADRVFTEVKLDLGSQMKMAKLSMLPDDQTLKDVLPAELYQRVKKLFDDKKIPFFGVNRMKIWAVAVQVSLLDHFKEMAAKQPLDAIIFMRAGKAKKPVDGIETMQEQLDVFDSLSREDQIHMLDKELEERKKHQEQGIDVVKVLLDAYLKGDELELMRRLKEDYDPEDPVQKKLMKHLFTDRNVRMAERIAEKLKAAPDQSFFFAVGAGHIPGEKGIADLLGKQGFKVVRLGNPH